GPRAPLRAPRHHATLGRGPGPRALCPHRREAPRHDRGRGSARWRSALRRAHPGRHRGTSMSRRVLVVDDNAELADNLRALLELEGFEVLVFTSPADALANADELAFDAALLDIRMPG